MNYKLTFFTADMVAVNCFELTHIHRQISNETPSALSSIEWKKWKRSQTNSEIVFSLAYLQAVFNLSAKKTQVCKKYMRDSLISSVKYGWSSGMVQGCISASCVEDQDKLIIIYYFCNFIHAVIRYSVVMTILSNLSRSSLEKESGQVVERKFWI